MLNPNVSEHVFTLPESPTGPLTVDKELRIAQMSKTVLERVSHGNAFIPSGSHERTRTAVEELQAKKELLLETHPELAGLYQEHQLLLNQAAQARTTDHADTATLEEQCRLLGRRIVEIEQSVGL